MKIKVILSAILLTSLLLSSCENTDPSFGDESTNDSTIQTNTPENTLPPATEYTVPETSGIVSAETQPQTTPETQLSTTAPYTNNDSPLPEPPIDNSFIGLGRTVEFETKVHTALNGDVGGGSQVYLFKDKQSLDKHINDEILSWGGSIDNTDEFYRISLREKLSLFDDEFFKTKDLIYTVVLDYKWESCTKVVYMSHDQKQNVLYFYFDRILAKTPQPVTHTSNDHEDWVVMIEIPKNAADSYKRFLAADIGTLTYKFNGKSYSVSELKSEDPDLINRMCQRNDFKEYLTIMSNNFSHYDNKDYYPYAYGTMPWINDTLAKCG